MAQEQTHHAAFSLGKNGGNDKARAGFEPANDGFANRCLSQLGDRARRRLEDGLYRDSGKISISDGGCLTAWLNRRWQSGVVKCRHINHLRAPR
jgi:hypothetical protein